VCYLQVSLTWYGLQLVTHQGVAHEAWQLKGETCGQTALDEECEGEG